MTVIIAQDAPDAIRGMLKRWFIEPKPNVFVGTLNPRIHEKTIEYIKRNAAGVGLLIIGSYPNCQGYRIETSGPAERKGIEVSGLWMVAEKWDDHGARECAEHERLADVTGRLEGGNSAQNE
jgi:CRISPR-associated protein Cas2